MRRFVPGAEVPDDVLARLLQAAHAAPSVGLVQPWRFIRITDVALRRRIHGLVDDERAQTALALGPRSDEFLALKVEGILECAELFVVALGEGRAATSSGAAPCRRWIWPRCPARSRTCGWPRGRRASA